MKYNFPYIAHLNDVLPAIKSREEFIVGERDWGYVIDYLFQDIDTFPRPTTRNDEINRLYTIRRECRGIKFDTDGNIIARPLHKFFNLNERPETLSQNVSWDKPFIILEKLDGSMLHPMYIGKDIRWCTMLGPTEVAEKAEAHAIKHNYNDFAKMMIDDGYTPVFEWCSRKQRIVVDYPEDKLVLLGARHMNTGEYLSYNKFSKLGNEYNIPVVEQYTDSFTDITSFVEKVSEMENEEGYILKFNDGHACKIKNFWYLNLHKSINILKYEKDIWKLIFSEQQDDAKAFMSDEQKDAIDQFAHDLHEAVKKTSDDYDFLVKCIRDNVGESMKKFANEVKDHRDSGILFNIDQGMNAHEAVMQKVNKYVGIGDRSYKPSATHIDEIRYIAGDLKWDDYNPD